MIYYIDLNDSDPLKKIPQNVDSHRVLHIKAKLDLNGADGVTIIELRLAEKLQSSFITDWLVDDDEEGCCDEDETIKKFLELGSNIYYVRNWNKSGKIKSKFARYCFYYDLFKHTGYRAVYCDTDSPSRVRLLYVAKMAGVPKRILHSHNSKCEGGIGSLNYRISQAMMPSVVTDCLACSQAAAEWMFPKKIRNSVKIIRNGLDSNEWRFNSVVRARIRQEMGLQDAFVIGHVGRFVKQKNHQKLIAVFDEIYKRNDKARLILIGDGPLNEKIHKDVEQRNINDAVLFIGITDHVSDFMQAMDVFLFPSVFEGLPLTMIEAQAAGLPCICTDNISKEVKATDLVEFLSLEELNEKWAKFALKFDTNYERKDTTEMIKAGGYDINDSAKQLTEILGGIETVK